jgi:hypothetical protein
MRLHTRVHIKHTHLQNTTFAGSFGHDVKNVPITELPILGQAALKLRAQFILKNRPSATDVMILIIMFAEKLALLVQNTAICCKKCTICNINFQEKCHFSPKIAENRRKLPKIAENCQKMPKIAENCRKSPKIAENRRKSPKIAENRRKLKS